MSPAVEVWSLNPWSSRGVPRFLFSLTPFFPVLCGFLALVGSFSRMLCSGQDAGRLRQCLLLGGRPPFSLTVLCPLTG